MLSSALIGCFTVPLISKKETQGGKYIFKYFLSQLYRQVIILYIKRGHQGACFQVFFNQEIYMRKLLAHCMSFPCTELILFNYAKVKIVFHSMAPLKALVVLCVLLLYYNSMYSCMRLALCFYEIHISLKTNKLILNLKHLCLKPWIKRGITLSVYYILSRKDDKFTRRQENKATSD